MIPLQIIANFIGTLFLLFGANALLAQWQGATAQQRGTVATYIQDFIHAWINETKQKGVKIPEPDPFDGKPENVAGWTRHVTSYFQESKETSEWKKIAYALHRITGSRTN